MNFRKKIIGKQDKIDFPDLGIYNIEVKVDTGAYTSCLHCHNIRIVKKENIKYLKFNILDPTHPSYKDKEFSFSSFKRKIIKSSSGHSNLRYIIKTKILIFNELHSVEFSLNNRSSMKYPVLLGRKFLYDRFIVDVTKKDLSFKEKNIDI